MNTNKVILAVIPGAIAVATLVLSFRSQINADAVVGYVAVLTVLGVLAVEYRINWRRIFGR